MVVGQSQAGPPGLHSGPERLLMQPKLHVLSDRAIMSHAVTAG